MVGTLSHTSGSGLQEMLRSMQKGREEALAASDCEALAAQTRVTAPEQFASARASSSNLMSRNFASAEQEQSKYLKARQAGQQAVNRQAGRQMAILAAGMAELDALGDSDRDNYAIRSLIGRKAARRMLEEGQRTVREESERNLEEITDNVERRAQEAVAVQGVDGKPVDPLVPENSGEPAPMPEISDSSPAPAPEAAPAAIGASGTGAAPAPVLASEPTVAAPPAVRSIDITV